MIHTDAMNDDRFDALLADFFRWQDQRPRADANEFFDASRRNGVDSELLRALRTFVSDNEDIDRNTSSAVSFWIDEEPVELTAQCPKYQDAVHHAPKLPRSIGDFTLLEEIGRGGMGVVYRAHQRSLERTVCVKMILKGHLAGERDVQRFLSEAKSMAALRHPNIVAVYEVSQYEDQYFFAMEYVSGQTLSQLVSEWPLTSDKAADYVRAVADALSYAHSKSILHRDIKPSNIIVDGDGLPRVTDFGLARHVDAEPITNPGALVGTPSYMAPELTRTDADVDVACDVYGLGAVLYELLTARPPFQGESPLDTLVQVREREPVAPRLLNPRVPRDLETICLKCLSKRPGQRYASAAEVRDELDRYLRKEPIRARRVSGVVRFANWCRRHPLSVALVGTVIAALLFVAGVVMRANVILSDANSALVNEQGRNLELMDTLKQQRRRADINVYLSRIRQASQAVAHGNNFEGNELLLKLVPAAGEEDFRGWEWYYLRCISRQYEKSIPLDASARAVAWGPGEQLATIDGRSKLRIYDSLSDSDPEIVEIVESAGCLSWNRVSGAIAVGLDDGRVHIIRRGSKMESLTDAALTESVRCVAWSPDGVTLAAGLSDGSIVIWDTSRLSLPRHTRCHSDRVNSMSWSHDGRWLATASDDASVKVISREADSVAVTLTEFSDWVNAVAFSPGALSLVAVTQGGELAVWDMSLRDGSMSVEARFERPMPGPLTTVVWPENGDLLAIGTESGAVQIVGAETGETLRVLNGHEQKILGVDCRETKLATASADRTVKTWYLERFPDGRYLQDGSTPIRYVQCHPNLPLLAWRDVDGQVTVWDSQRDGLVQTFDEPAASATAMAWHPVDAAIAIGRDDLVLMYDLRKSGEVTEVRASAGIWHIEWDRTGEFLAIADMNGEITVWNNNGSLMTRLPSHGSAIRGMVWSPDASHLFSVDTSSNLRSWSVPGGRLASDLPVTPSPSTSVSISPSGRWLAVGSEDGTLHIVDAEGLHVLQSLQGHRGAAWTTAWSLDGNRLISGGQEGTIRVWHLESGEETLRLSAHAAAVWSLDVNENGVVSVGADGSVRVWRTTAL